MLLRFKQINIKIGNNCKDYYLLFGIIILHFTFWFFIEPGNHKSDDAIYIHYAEQIMNGTFKFSFNQFANRFTIFVPVALMFKVFGITTYSPVFWTLIASIITIISVYFFTKKNINQYTAMIAGLLIACNIMQITYSAALFPDLILAMFILLTLIGLYNRSQVFPPALLVSFCLIAGLMTKELVIILIPFMILLAIFDISNSQNISFWFMLILLFFTLGIIYFGIYKIGTGDFFYIVKALKYIYSEQLKYDYNGPLGIKNGLKQNAFMLLNNNIGYIFIFLMAIPSLFQSLLNYRRYFSNFQFFISVYLVVLFSEYLFLSSSHNPTRELFYVERTWVLIIVPLSILAADSIKMIGNKNGRLVLIYFFISFICDGIFNYLEVSVIRSFLFFIFASISCIHYFILIKKHNSLSSYFKWHLVIPFIIIAGYFVIMN